MKLNIPIEINENTIFGILLEAVHFDYLDNVKGGYENCHTAKINEETRGLFCEDTLIDGRGELYDILMLLANQIYPNMENRHIYGDIDTYIKNRK